jgi:uncharacterized membrane protein YbhN (UPF0104 family)
LPFALKALAAGAVLALVLARVEPARVIAVFIDIRSLPLALAFLWVAAAIVVSAAKWGRILARRGLATPLLELTRLYYIASFFNAVLPTSVGGDPVRAWMLGREKRDMPEAFASVVAERLIASVALGLSSAIGLLLVPATPRLVGLVAVFLVVDAGIVALFLVPRFSERFVRAVMPERLGQAADATCATLGKVRETLRDRSLVTEVLVWSIAFQACVAMVNHSLYAAFGSPVSIGQALLYSPMISTVLMLPASLSGLGLPQAAYAFFFAHSGVSEAVSVAVSFGFFVVVALSTLPGALLFVFARRTGETDGL